MPTLCASATAKVGSEGVSRAHLHDVWVHNAQAVIEDLPGHGLGHRAAPFYELDGHLRPGGSKDAVPAGPKRFAELSLPVCWSAHPKRAAQSRTCQS